MKTAVIGDLDSLHQVWINCVRGRIWSKLELWQLGEVTYRLDDEIAGWFRFSKTDKGFQAG